VAQAQAGCGGNLSAQDPILMSAALASAIVNALLLLSALRQDGNRALYWSVAAVFLVLVLVAVVSVLGAL